MSSALWRNFVKRRAERRPEPATPAIRVGLADAQWTGTRALSRRLFPQWETRAPLQRTLYDRAWIAPVLRCNTRHALT
jgi:hypothetical protein